VIAIAFVLGFRALGIYLENLGWFLAPAGVAVGFGLTQILSNFVSGIILFLERPVQVGDIITVGEIEGDVTRISIRSTVIRTRDGVSIILPNRKLIEEDVVNWSHSDPRTRMRVGVSVAYGSDVPLVKRTLLEVADRDTRILRRPRPEVQFKGFGESELQFVLFIWLETPDIGMRRRVLSDVNSAIDAAFRRAGITIPFPQRDLHLKTVPGDQEAREGEATAPPAAEEAIAAAGRREAK
jgi:small-conductance mechanosensitive channel